MERILISTTAENTEKKKYTKWFVLALTALSATLAVTMPMMAIPVLFAEISRDLSLNLVQVGTIWGIGSLAGILTGFFGGSIGDRFGTNRTLVVAFILTGIIGAVRGFAFDYFTLAGAFFIGGFLGPAIPTNLHKICGDWFPGKQLGVANGVLSSGMALGAMTGAGISATILSPWFGGWRNVIIFYAVIAVIIGLAWLFVPDPPGNLELLNPDGSSMSFMQSLRHISKIRNIWFLSIAALGIGGAIQGFLGYLPLYLRNIGWSTSAADGTLVIFHAVSMVATIPIAIISGRIGKRKVIVIFACIMTTLGLSLLYFADGPFVWIAVIMVGIMRDAYMAILITMITETKGIGASLTATAMGLVMVLPRVGSIFSPPLGNSLANINPSLPFLFWAGLAAFSIVGFVFVIENGRGKEIKI